MKRSIPVLLFVLALALSACAPTVVAGDGAPPQRIIQVNGVGQAVLTPDIATVTIGVQTEADSARDAVSENNRQAEAIIEALRAAGIAEKDIRTTNFSIYPNTRYDRDGNPAGVSYVVQNSVFVTVRDLEIIGQVLDAAVEAGANQIYGIEFDVADKTAALAAARDAAVQQARQQAEALAKAAGVSIDKVQSISYYTSQPTPAPMERALFAEAASAVPIQSGSLTLTVTVDMVFTLK